jgi:hypothetical protein
MFHSELSNINYEGEHAMSKKSLIVFPIFLLLVSTAFPLGRGGGQGAGSGQGGRGYGGGQGQGPGMGQGQSRGQNANAQMERKRIRVTQQQQEQLRSCDKLADGIRKQVRKMAKDSDKNFEPGKINQQQTQVRNQIRQMEQEHERLMNGLDTTQQEAWQEQIQNMKRLREQLNQHEQKMDAELKGNPDAKRVAERAREMEQTMNEWRKQYGILSSQAEN